MVGEEGDLGIGGLIPARSAAFRHIRAYLGENVGDFGVFRTFLYTGRDQFRRIRLTKHKK